MAKALKARIDALEAVMGDIENGPRTIIIERYDASADGNPLPDDSIIGMTSHDTTLVRQPGETVAELDARAEAYPPHYPGGVRCWIRQYREASE